MFAEDQKSRAGEAGPSEFEKLLSADLKAFKEGDIITGTVIEMTKDSVMIDVGYKSEGVVALREFRGEDGEVTLKVGDEVTVLLEKREDDHGYVRLSKSKADQYKVWDTLIEACENNTPVPGCITQRIKGGFYVDVNGVTAFLPGSQVDLKPVRNPDALIGQEFEFVVLKHNRRKNNVIISRRTILEKEREKLREITLANLEEGALVEGLVKNITDYGAFLDLGGIDGLVHLTDLSWGKVSHPTQILNIGDTVTVKVLKYNKEDGKISLGLKQTKEDPWLSVGDKYEKGARVRGRVVNITDYGCFVELVQGLEGLVHISEMSWTKIRHPSQKLKVDDEIEVMILDIDAEHKRISLGLKQVEANPWDGAEERYPRGSKITGVVKNITDFGIFVGVEDGIDGLVHISDLTWKKVKHPSEVYRKGQEVDAQVLNIDAKNRRFSLSTKLLERNPWEGVQDRYTPGMTIDGRVTSVADFGAFVELEDGLEGLVHISELNRGKKKGDEVGVNDIVEVEVLNVDPEDNKIGLSIRCVKESAAEAASAKEAAEAAETKEAAAQEPAECSIAAKEAPADEAVAKEAAPEEPAECSIAAKEAPADEAVAKEAAPEEPAECSIAAKEAPADEAVAKEAAPEEAKQEKVPEPVE